MLDSNLATCTRLQLILRCLQVFWKSLSDEQKGALDEADRSLLDQLSAKRASQFVYALEEASKPVWLDGLGGLLLRLYQCYSPESSPRYALIARLLLEQYRSEGEGEGQHVVLKPAQEIRADSLQSPDDDEAAYRSRRRPWPTTGT